MKRFWKNWGEKEMVWIQEESLSQLSGWKPGVVALRSPEAAHNSIVMACVNWAMRNVGQATPVVQQNINGSWQNISGHWAERLLTSPQGRLARGEKSRIDARKLLSAMTLSRMLDGNAYVQKIRNARGEVIGLDWVPHQNVEPIPVGTRPSVPDFYQVQGVSGSIRIEVEDMIHDLDGVDPANPVKGISRLSSVMRQILTDNQISAYSQAILSNPVPSLMVTAKTDGTRVSQKDADYLAQKMREVASGSRAGGVIVPTFPAEVTPIGFKPDDLAIGDLNRLPEERITAVFGIPAMVLGLGAGMERSTYSNMREAREAATEEFLVPLWQDLAQTFTEQLLEDRDRMMGLRVWFDLSEVGTLQDDRNRLHQRVRADYQAGLIDKETALQQLGLGSRGLA